ncbi:MAG: carboxypeptidase-like regulatory domain-containing protein [Rudanella sp.]|nr:carboxypeptidase-like regulatory domain-containing protein [Rudanella sp.]
MKKTLLLGLLMVLLSGSLLYAQRGVSGTVNTDEGTGGLSGVTVTVKDAGTASADTPWSGIPERNRPNRTTGTITDANGQYRLTIPNSATALVFSAVGMQTLEETIGGRTTINVQLRTDTRQLGEVIITALGIKAERDKFASSIATVEGKNIAKTGETSLLTGLSGKVAGVLIPRNGGDPGAGAYIQIRGQNTINGNAQPLFIVDGRCR